MSQLKVRQYTAVIVTRKRCWNHPSCAKEELQRVYKEFTFSGCTSHTVFQPLIFHLSLCTAATYNKAPYNIICTAFGDMNGALFTQNWRAFHLWGSKICLWCGRSLRLHFVCFCVHVCAFVCAVTVLTPHSIVFDPDRQAARADVPC